MGMYASHDWRNDVRAIVHSDARERAHHKYVARVKTKSDTWRYFYNQQTYQTWLKNQARQLSESSYEFDESKEGLKETERYLTEVEGTLHKYTGDNARELHYQKNYTSDHALRTPEYKEASNHEKAGVWNEVAANAKWIIDDASDLAGRNERARAYMKYYDTIAKHATAVSNRLNGKPNEPQVYDGRAAAKEKEPSFIDSATDAVKKAYNSGKNWVKKLFD